MRPAIILLMLIIAITVAYAQETAVGMDSYFLSTSAPPGWEAASPTDIPLRLKGTFLAGWQKKTAAGPAALYLVGVRRGDVFTVTDAGASFTAYLTEKKVQFAQDSKFTIGGRDATKFTFTAPGNGQIVTALSASAKSDVSTYMEIIIIANGWVDGKGTDLIHFVFAAPAAAKDALRPAFKSVASMSSVKGKHDPGQEAAGDDEGGEGEEGNLIASGTVVPGQTPVLKPGPLMPISISAPVANSALPAGTRFLLAVPAGETAIWVSPQHEIGAWYVLVWPAKHEAYVLSGEEYKTLASTTEGLLVVAATPALKDHLNRWDKLWAPPSGQAK